MHVFGYNLVALKIEDLQVITSTDNFQHVCITSVTVASVVHVFEGEYFDLLERVTIGLNEQFIFSNFQHWF